MVDDELEVAVGVGCVAFDTGAGAGAVLCAGAGLDAGGGLDATADLEADGGAGFVSDALVVGMGVGFSDAAGARGVESAEDCFAPGSMYCFMKGKKR